MILENENFVRYISRRKLDDLIILEEYRLSKRIIYAKLEPEDKNNQEINDGTK